MNGQILSRQRLTLLFGIVAGTVTISASGLLAAPPKKAKPTPKPAAAKPDKASTMFVDNTPLTDEQRIVHALNRIGFGPRPGDVKRVQAIGLSRYIEQQLHPEQINDSKVEAKLAGFDALEMTNAELAAMYVGELRTGIEAKKLQEDIMANARKNGVMMDEASPETMSDPAERRKRVQQLMVNATPEQREELRKKLDDVKKQGRQNTRLASQELVSAKVIRAVESERQLNEVMVDFWTNHFNIDINKNVCRAYKIADDRDVIRQHAFGKFRDLLGTSAKSPAMLVYLDNVQSTKPTDPNDPREKRRQAAIDRMAKMENGDAQLTQQVQKNRGKGGLNENYARELMELHTLGVDGGYTQKDVQEVARCLTGWGVGGRRGAGAKGGGAGGTFEFHAVKHDNGEKTVLGNTIPANGGILDGERVLDILARHPSTMRNVSTKLCKRFVSDEPPASLVNKCIATWKRTDGDIREIVRTIVTSGEFYSRDAYRKKIKSPFEYSVSCVRALGGTVRTQPDGMRVAGNARLAARNGGQLSNQVRTMGQPLFECQPPTGYPENSQKWVSSGALVSRLNYALGLTAGSIADVDLSGIDGVVGNAPDPAATVNHLSHTLLYGDMSPSTRATLLKQAQSSVAEDSPAAGVAITKRLIALTLGSPEFQRR